MLPSGPSISAGERVRTGWDQFDYESRQMGVQCCHPQLETYDQALVLQKRRYANYCRRHKREAQEWHKSAARLPTLCWSFGKDRRRHSISISEN
jgi:hypothetical protein